MKKEDKEELMNEVLGKKRPYSSVYTDSMDILKTTEDELNRIIAENEKKLQEMTQRSSYSEDKINSLKAEIEKDFNVKIDLPETVVVGKESKEVFEEIEKEMNEICIGQEKAVDDITVAFRRPYVTGSDPKKIRNSILLMGSNGSGRHLLIETMADLLKKHGLTVSSEVIQIDMSRYQSSSQEAPRR